MSQPDAPAAILATEIAARTKPSNYPEPFAARMAGREKRQLGDFFGLTNFGVNLTRLSPGAGSALRHSHSRQDEFIYILQGHPTLLSDAGETQLSPGMCAGFKAGTGNAHQLLNRTGEEIVYLEIGDRTAGDSVVYPDDDLQATLINGNWQFTHKDGTPY
ncbi:MAG TPA: cupin domain-containing protein [Gallionellaceae bacterium]